MIMTEKFMFIAMLNRIGQEWKLCDDGSIEICAGWDRCLSFEFDDKENLKEIY